MAEPSLSTLVDRLKKQVSEFDKLVRERIKIDERIKALAEDLGKLGIPTEPLSALTRTTKKRRGRKQRSGQQKKAPLAKAAPAKKTAPAKRTKRAWTAAERKEKSEQMKKYWAEKRSQQGPS